MRLYQLDTYSSKQIHRVYEGGTSVCDYRVTKMPGKWLAEEGAAACVNARRLCGVCFKTKDIIVLAKPDSRITLSRCE